MHKLLRFIKSTVTSDNAITANKLVTLIGLTLVNMIEYVNMFSYQLECLFAVIVKLIPFYLAPYWLATVCLMVLYVRKNKVN